MNKCESAETLDMLDKAAAAAPVLRMLFAAGRGGLPSVIYLGGVCPPAGYGAVRVDTDSGDNTGRGTGADGGPEMFSEAVKTAAASALSHSDAQSVSVYVGGAGLFACGQDLGEALSEASRVLAGASNGLPDGGAVYDGRHKDAIRESAGRCVKAGEPFRRGRLEGKIALITGGAQGFGRGIAGELAAEGAYVAVADLNYEGACKCAEDLSEKYGAGKATAISANVTDEGSVAAMVRETVLLYGGLDLYISNAGVLIAGALPEIKKEQFEFVTSVNYTGYFLGVKHASVPMKIQRGVCASYTADIIEINSKSGLEGSNKNFAYAGSKFGGLGLTQSFALELVEYGIKVNAICPGNFLDGPLWSDPVKGLFKQYLDAGKVPGAKSVDDVRRHYESRVPMKRGCTVEDVATAIFYLVEQRYETGQALPVTGGQVMLN